MKNPGNFVLLAITLLFLGFTFGLILGQNGLRGSDVAVSQIPQYDEGNPSGPTQEVFIVNINTADASLLESLPGVGPVLAQRIVQYRSDNGPFASVEDLKNVSGIGEKKMEDIRPWITTGG